MSAGPFGLLSELTQSKNARSARVSSWDQSGKNRDNWVIAPGASILLADIQGPGNITHIWMTQTCRLLPELGTSHSELLPLFAGEEISYAMGLTCEVVDPDYYRKVLIKFYWDDQVHPSVLVPLGDFFGLMNSLPGTYSSLPLTVSAVEGDEHTFGGNVAFNSYFHMPFNKRCRIEIENQNTVPYIQYFNIDYELYKEPLPADTLYFHSQWRRENTTDGWAPELHVHGNEMTKAVNLDGDGNYLILETEGRGHYIGCNLAVRHFHDMWWGEGDDMIFIDDDTWPPSVHGTGSEDYFGNAWGMQRTAFPMNGSIVNEKDVPGFQHSYRFHITDPVRFEKRIKVTMEHGHANHLADDWSSTAYWYQTLPSPQINIAPLNQRLPLRPTNQKKPSKELSEVLSRRGVNFEDLKRERDELYERWIKDAVAASLGNIQQAAEIRSRYIRSK
jgi:hypothetical protein